MNELHNWLEACEREAAAQRQLENAFRCMIRLWQDDNYASAKAVYWSAVQAYKTAAVEERLAWNSYKDAISINVQGGAP